MQVKHDPKPGWNDDDESPRSPAVTPEDIRHATRELTDKIGLGGSLGAISSGGARISRGVGFHASREGARKSQIEPDGDAWFGSDVSTPDGVTLAVFVNAQEYNNEDMEEGDLLFGDNSDDTSNVKFDRSEGQWQFRLGTTVNVYMDTDGSLHAGDVVLSAAGIRLPNSLTSWFQFADASGNYTITIAADPNNDFEFSNLATSPAGLISFFLKLGGVTSKVFGIASDYVTFTKVPVWFNPNGEDIDFLASGDTNPYVFSLNAGLNRIEIGKDDSGQTAVHILDPQGTSYINEPGYDLDLIIRDASSNDLVSVDASAGTVTINGALSVTGSLTGGVAAETNGNVICSVSAPGGVSAFAGTIATLPGGAPTTLTYNITSGQEGAMKPTGTTQLAKMVLFNTTRGTNALISDCTTGTNTLTLTTNVPLGWTVGDTITIASQTVTGGGYSWVDMKLTSGPTGRHALFVNALITSGAAGDETSLHPTATYGGSKRAQLIAQVAAVQANGFGLIPLTNNTFSWAWTANSTVITVREAGYIA